ncbi:hypothetical protein E2562_014131 [Oryza meyeriana var. granulata]|uniref:Uncharacterized protein n=1 Tax=Oryza meyeriana var. granulata TaxID=110450 RepID=A0A6G1F8F7_9ORYZ|nr:hypothetical protein E2562_014131 [Oryza meyeriana var. granulata]
MVKRKFVDHQTTLHRFTRRMLDVVISRKEKEAAKTHTCSGKPIVKTRWPFAVQLSRVYMRTRLKVFEETLDDNTAFRIDMDGNDGTRWVVSHTKCSENHNWCQQQFKVLANVDSRQYECECK